MPAPVYGVLLVSFSPHSHQRNFAPVYASHPRLRLVAVTDEADVSPGLRAVNEGWALDLGVPYIEGIDAALALGHVDIVSIGHEIERRADLIQRAALAGKHLWIDKFTGANLDECDRVVEAVEAAGVRAIVPSFAYGDLVERGLQACAEPRIGALLGVHVDVHFGKGWPRPVGPDHTVAGAGQWTFPDIKRELLTVGAYAVGLVQACMGPIRTVVGYGGAHFFPEHAARRAEDFATLTLIDNCGRVATLSAGRTGVAGHAGGGTSRAWVVGSRGTIAIDAKRPAISHHLRGDLVSGDFYPRPDDPMQWAGGPPTQSSPVGADMAGLSRGLEDLISALDTGCPPRFTVRHARDNMEIVLAGYRALAEGAPISLPLSRGETLA